MSNKIDNAYPSTAEEYVNQFIHFLQLDILAFFEINKSRHNGYIYNDTHSIDDNEQRKSPISKSDEKWDSSILNNATLYNINPAENPFCGQMSIPMMLYLFSYMDFIGFLVRKGIIKKGEDEEGNLIYINPSKENTAPNKSTKENIKSYLTQFMDESIDPNGNKEDFINLFRHGLIHVGFPKNNLSITTNASDNTLLVKKENGKECLNVWMFAKKVEETFQRVRDYLNDNLEEVNTNYDFLVNEMSGKLNRQKHIYYEVK